MAPAAADDDPAAGRRDDARPRGPAAATRVRIAGALLAVALFAFSAAFSWQAPFGVWENQLFGGPTWNEGDPGAFYVPAAHQLARGKSPIFIGHPGAPLMLLLREVQRVYWMAAAPPELGYTDFIVRHLPTTYLLSKLAMTLLHLASLWALFRCARLLLASDGAALFAAAGYATSLPVFYYLSRISVEPLMMFCFFTALTATWRGQELARAGRRAAAFAQVALAGLAAATGAVSKLHFLGPMPFFLALYLLWGERRAPGAGSWRSRVAACGILLGVSAATAMFWSQWIDWQAFARIWQVIVATTPEPKGWSLLPGPTPAGALPLCELAFVGLGVAGFARFLRRHPEARSRALWLAAYTAFALAFFAYRIALAENFLPFHYFFLPDGVIAIFFGYGMASWLRRLSPVDAAPRVLWAGLGLVALIHGLGIAAVVDSRRHDATVYASRRAIYDLIAQLGPRQRLGVPVSDYDWPIFRARLAPLPAVPLEHSVLPPHFEALFVQVTPEQAAQAPRRLYVPALRTEVVVVDGEPHPDARPARRGADRAGAREVRERAAARLHRALPAPRRASRARLRSLGGGVPTLIYGDGLTGDHFLDGGRVGLHGWAVISRSHAL